MAIKKMKSDLVPLTRELALRFFRMRPVPGERPKKPVRLRHFKTLLKDGRFGSPSWSEALIGEDPEPWRGDGQHTSDVLANCDESLFPVNGTVTHNIYHLDSTAEIGEFFELFDNPRSVRSNQDKLSVYIAQHAEVQDIDPGFLGKVLHGIHYYNLDLSRQAESKGVAPLSVPVTRDLGVYLEEKQNVEFALWLTRWRDTRHTWMVAKPGITAEIFADWKGHPEIASRFWNEVFTESNPDGDDESRELIRTFLDWNGRQPATPQERFRTKAHKLWERYRRTAAAPAVAAEPAATPVMAPAAA